MTVISVVENLRKGTDLSTKVSRHCPEQRRGAQAPRSEVSLQAWPGSVCRDLKKLDLYEYFCGYTCTCIFVCMCEWRYGAKKEKGRHEEAAVGDQVKSYETQVCAESLGYRSTWQKHLQSTYRVS